MMISIVLIVVAREKQNAGIVTSHSSIVLARSNWRKKLNVSISRQTVFAA